MRNLARWAGIALVVALATSGLAMSKTPPKPVPELTVSTEAAFLVHAIPLVARWEGLRTEAYWDAYGKVWTVCYGETVGVKKGDRYTEAECAEMLGRRILDYRAGLHRHLTAQTIATRLPATRDAAYSSLTYNIGVGAAGKSTAVRRLNEGDIAGGCEAITWWNRAGSRVVRGLVHRRADEYRLCMRGISDA